MNAAMVVITATQMQYVATMMDHLVVPARLVSMETVSLVKVKDF